MNPFLLLLLRRATSYAPALWVSEAHTYNATERRMEVTWRLTRSGDTTPALQIPVYHTGTNGSREYWTWDIESGLASAEGLYYYPVDDLGNTTVLEFAVLPGQGYSLPDTKAQPARVEVPVESSGGGGGGGSGGGGTGIPVPDKDALSWEDNVSLTGGGTQLIEGRNFRSTNGGAMLDLSQLNDGTHITIRRCHFRGGGIGLFVGYAKIRLTVEHCFFFADTFSETIGWGKWLVTASNPYKIIFEHNYCEGGGVNVEITSPSWGNNFEGCWVRYNLFKNIHGNPNDYLSANQGVFNVQGNDANIPNVFVEWNEVWNEENKTHCEDLVNLFRVGGTVAAPITIRHNFIRGSYYNPVNRMNPGGIFSGGGIICEMTIQDANWNTNLLLEHNMFTHLKNYCAGIAGGNNITIRYNKIRIAGQHDDGSYFNSWSSGIWASQYYGDEDPVTKEKPIYSGRNVVAHDNEIGVRNTSNTQGTGDDFHMELGNSAGLINAYNNITWEQLGKFPTLADEAALYQEWQQKLQTNTVTLGPLAP
jgi:hypothetical protein